MLFSIEQSLFGKWASVMVENGFQDDRTWEKHGRLRRAEVSRNLRLTAGGVKYPYIA